MRGADLERDLSTRANRIDRDDRGRTRNARALHRAQAEWSAPHDRDDRSGFDERNVLRRRSAESGDGDATADHAELGGRRFREDRDDPFFECHHLLGEAADVRVGIHRCAVAHVGDRHEIVGALPAEELTHVRLGRADTDSRRRTAACPIRRRDHPLGRDALPGRPPRRSRRRRVPVSTPSDSAVRIPSGPVRPGAARSEQGHGRRGWRAEVGLDAEHGTHVRVTEVRGLGSHDDLASTDRPQREVVQRGAPAPVPRDTQPRNRCLVTTEALFDWASAASCGAMAIPLAAASPAFRRSRRVLLVSI